MSHTGRGGSFCRLRGAIRRPGLGGHSMVTGYRVPLPLGYAGGGHGGSCVFNRITYVGGLFTDSAWTIAVRVAIYDAHPSLPLSLTWDPAVAGFRSLGVAWLRLWCSAGDRVLPLLIIGGRVRLPGLRLGVLRPCGPPLIRVCTHRLIRDLKELVSVWRGLSPAAKDSSPKNWKYAKRCTSLMLRSKCLK